MGRKKLNKEHLHIYIDKDVLERAKALIPNLSAFVEMKLKEAVILAEHGLTQCGGRDSNPRTPSGQGLKPCAFSWLGNPRFRQYLQCRL